MCDFNILDAIAIDESKGIYREIQYNIVIEQKGRELFAKGVLLDPSKDLSKTRPLDSREREFCENRNIIISEDEESDGDMEEEESINDEIEKCTICQDNLHTLVKEIYSLRCGHKIHSDCMIEYLRNKPNGLKLFYRYTNKSKLFKEILGDFRCTVCRKESMVYKKEEIPPQIINDIEAKTIVKVTLPKNFTQTTFNEIWLQKPGDLLTFRKVKGPNGSPQFDSPIEVIDKCFENRNKEPLRYHLIYGGLMPIESCRCSTSYDLHHMTVDEFYKMIYHHSHYCEYQEDDED